MNLECTSFPTALNSQGESLMKINGKESPTIDFGDGSDPAYLEAVKITAYSETVYTRAVQVVVGRFLAGNDLDCHEDPLRRRNGSLASKPSRTHTLPPTILGRHGV